MQSPLQFSAALRVLRGQMCCRCSSSCSFAALRGQKRCSPSPFVDRPNYDLAKVFFVALRGPPWTKGSCSRRCSSPRPSVSSVDKCVAVAVLRVPSLPFVDKKGVPPVPSWTDQIMIWQRFSSWPFAALRGQKEVAVAVAVLRGPPCPPWTNVLPLQFFVFLRCPSWTKKVFPTALRGQTIFSHCTPFPDYINYR